MSKITFETAKEFLRFQFRLVLMHFIRYMHVKIYPWLFYLPRRADWEIKRKKCSISATNWTKLVTYGKHFLRIWLTFANVLRIRLVGVVRRRNLESIMWKGKGANCPEPATENFTRCKRTNTWAVKFVATQN